MRSLVFLACFVTLYYCLVDAAQPTGCSYSTETGSRGLYTCDFAVMTLPVTYSAFTNPIPQRLKIRNINGNLPVSSPTKSFNGFGSYSTGSHDSDFTSYLELECSTGSPSGQAIISMGTFSQMTYLEELHIRNCRLTNGLPEYIFADFKSLNILTIEGGSIDAMAADAMADFNITVSTSLTKSRGILNFTNVAIAGGSITSGFFYHLKTVDTIILDNNGLTTLETAMFSQNTRLQRLIIRNNPITSFPNNMFSGLDSLLYVELSGMSLTCSCENVWFIKHFVDHNITLGDGALCSMSTNAKNAEKYYFENCVTYDICDGIPGLIVGDSCHHWFRILFVLLLIIAIILTILVLILLIHTRKKLMSKHDKLRAKQTEKWSKIQQVLNSQAVTKQKPPAATLPPKGVAR
ncbi:uncharacterized protein LOC134229304 [Saccostrea cucullata]|uniref:uncharacterized protein LOC134229304 n=1 Tax=Saccostrea cuccullata TaxID=36930 RepID=UPI002ED62289